MVKMKNIYTDGFWSWSAGNQKTKCPRWFLVFGEPPPQKKKKKKKLLFSDFPGL